MEEDFPNKHDDKKLPILDMKVWIDNNHMIVHQHYEKLFACRKVLNAKSAQSASCKKSVHVQEILRRIKNTSSRLDWSQTIAPVLTDYMTRMMAAGYRENYRRSVLTNAFRIHDKMVREHEEGIRPYNRPHDWQAEKRRLDKVSKNRNWSTKGGFIAPIIIPATPDSELLHMLREVAETEAVNGLKFKILEKGGKMVKRAVQKSNPTGSPGCTSPDCVACKEGRGKGGNCRKGNIEYRMNCNQCPEADPSHYIGETSRNIFTRGKEHVDKSKTKTEDSFIVKHQQQKHNGQPANFTGEVTGAFRDCLSRQVSEGVSIRRSKGNIMNSKSEWHQPALWRVRSEIEREF